MEYTNVQKIEYMMHFTTIYSNNSGNIYLREACCIDYQLSYTMLPIRQNDLFAGRKAELPIGFLPQTGDGVGYYCNEKSLAEMKNDSSLSEKDIDAIEYLMNFWKGKTTKEKIIGTYTMEQQELLSHGDFNTESGTAFPLYRMSGAQMNPEKLLSLGINGLILEIERKQTNCTEFYDAAKSALVTLQNLCLRYANEISSQAECCEDVKRADELWKMAENLIHIAHDKPSSMWQAAQLAYLYFLISGTYNYGRMDEYLGAYYTFDIDTGMITDDFALELIKSLWSLMIERNTVFDGRVILGGKDRKNIESADRFAIVAMEASRQTKDVLPQLTLRCYDGMNEKSYTKALEVISQGTTFPMLYNDDVNIPAVAHAFNVSLAQAAKYVPFGCGEYVLYNQSFGTPSGAINFLNGLNSSIYCGNKNHLEQSSDFDTFYSAYITNMSNLIMLLAQQEETEYVICGQDAPYLYFSILFDDCLECGNGVFEGGIRYLGGTVEGYGNVNAADSLTAIKTLVFDQKLITAQELTAALKNNFVGYSNLQRLLLSAPKYGNDDDTADGIAQKLHNDLCRIIRDCSKKTNLHSYLQVIINNSMNTTFGLTTGASADGRNANTYMANANNPTGGMDKNGITATLNSLVKLGVDHHAGSVQNMKFSKEMFGKLLPKTKALLATYFTMGGSQAMITVLNKGDLESAMLEPEKYQNLIVRVGGFSARFVELPKHVQQELLSRNLYE